MKSAMATTTICPNSSPTLNPNKGKVMSCSLDEHHSYRIAKPIP